MKSEPCEAVSQYIYLGQHATAPGMRQATMASRLGAQGLCEAMVLFGADKARQMQI